MVVSTPVSSLTVLAGVWFIVMGLAEIIGGFMLRRVAHQTAATEGREPLEFVLPQTRPQARWQVEVDTWELSAPPAGGGPAAGERQASDTVTAGPRSVVVLLSPLAAAS